MFIRINFLKANSQALLVAFLKSLWIIFSLMYFTSRQMFVSFMCAQVYSDPVLFRKSTRL